MSDREWENLTDNRADRYHIVIGVNDTQLLAHKNWITGKTDKGKKDAEIQFSKCSSCGTTYKNLFFTFPRSSLFNCLGLW